MAILTTHSGSLPRLVGDPGSGTALRHPTSDDEAVEFAVRRQRALGLDMVNDGEMTRPGYVHYLANRMTGIAPGGVHRLELADLADFPGFDSPLAGTAADRPRRLRCIGPIEYGGRTAIRTDITRLTSALGDGAGFLTAPSPGTVALFIPDHHYGHRSIYLNALADALRVEYEAILAAGLMLQVDCPDLAIDGAAVSPVEHRHRSEANLAALNRALDGLPAAAQRTRLHLCWGNYEGPHHFDIPLGQLVDLLGAALPGTIAFETANPRHGHEDAAWARLARAGKTLAPGVIDSTTNYIEHPELVAKRLRNVMQAADSDAVLATTDCGFSCHAGRHIVDPRIAWAKLGALVEGAHLVT